MILKTNTWFKLEKTTNESDAIKGKLQELLQDLIGRGLKVNPNKFGNLPVSGAEKELRQAIIKFQNFAESFGISLSNQREVLETMRKGIDR